MKRFLFQVLDNRKSRPWSGNLSGFIDSGLLQGIPQLQRLENRSSANWEI